MGRPEPILVAPALRVLEVLYSFRVGGSEVVGVELAQQLTRGGAVTMCSALEGMTGPLRDRCTDLGLPVVDLGLPQPGLLGRNGLSWQLVRRLRALRLDAIHLQHFVALNKLGVAARLAGVRRIVVSEHSEATLRASPAGRARLRLNWRLAHAITVIHDGLRRYLVEEIGVPDARITVIPNGIDSRLWHHGDRGQRRAELGLTEETAFVYVGRLAEVKNVPALIGAFLALQSRLTQPARLIVVGDGPEMAHCRALLASHPQAGTVMLLGEQHDTRRFLAAADAFVMNSSSEGTPRALLEAMTMGLPAICTAVGGIPQMLRGRGWLTRVGDAESLIAAMRDCVNEPARGREFGAAAAAYVASNYDAAEIGRRYRKLLDGG